MSFLKLQGIYPALITPFTKEETVDEKGLAVLTEYLIGQKVNGLYVGGSTGEALLLTLEERKRVLEIVTEVAADRVEVIAQIGCQHTAEAIALGKHAERAGAKGISSLPPIFYKYSLKELTRYYLEIMDAVSLPFIVYNAPALTGVFFDKDNVGDIFAHPNACGIKFTAYDSYRMQRLMAQYPKKTVINGHDEIYLSTLALGVNCAIGSTFNFMPGKFLEISRCFAAGDMNGARKAQDEVNQIIDALVEVGVFRGVKAMLTLMGLPGGSCRSPFAPISQAELTKLEPLLDLVR